LLRLMGDQARLRQRGGGVNITRKADNGGTELGEQEKKALHLLAEARKKEKELEQVEARMEDIAGAVDSGLNGDDERKLLREMSKLRQRKQQLQKEAMAMLDTASELAPEPGTAGATQSGRSKAPPTTATATVAGKSTRAGINSKRTQSAAAKAKPGALLKTGGASGGDPEVDWCETRISFTPFCTKNDHFTKTGSGQS
jgi:hypothetical protein